MEDKAVHSGDVNAVIKLVSELARNDPDGQLSILAAALAMDVRSFSVVEKEIAKACCLEIVAFYIDEAWKQPLMYLQDLEKEKH